MNAYEKWWMKEARRYSFHIYCYEDLIDDHPESTAAALADKQDPYEFVEYLGDKYGLTRCDQDWGIHSGIKFHKMERA